MKKETLIEIILGTIGSFVFGIGMCMCLLPEWNLFRTGVIVGLSGFVILLLIIPVYKKSHPKKEHAPINWSFVLAFVIGIVGSLILGFGMSKTMLDASRDDMILGIVIGGIGLIICVLDYPIYSYLKGKSE